MLMRRSVKIAAEVDKEMKEKEEAKTEKMSSWRRRGERRFPR